MRRLFRPVKEPYRVTADFYDIYPITPFYILRGVAARRHNAIDYAVNMGTPIHAPERIQVHEVRYTGVRTRVGYGKFIRAISLQDNVTEYIFAHLNTIPYPRVGKIWQSNQVMAWSGNSGWSTGPHLHFAMKSKGKWINPDFWEWID